MVVNQAADNLTWHLFFGPIVVFQQLLYILLDYFEFNDVPYLEMNITYTYLQQSADYELREAFF